MFLTNDFFVSSLVLPLHLSQLNEICSELFERGEGGGHQKITEDYRCGMGGNQKITECGFLFGGATSLLGSVYPVFSGVQWFPF